MAEDQPVAERSRNIVIFSDGTGQRGGVFFDEARTNIYKLYRATRVGPDSCINPDEQVAFYDPGLGTQVAGGPAITRMYRSVYNFISQATGLGITRNVIDCYAAIIRLWRAGDRIYLFGFSRGAYTVRCLASVICLCGIPRNQNKNQSLKFSSANTFKIASRAVKTVYQHVSSSRDAQFKNQREALADQFREEYNSGDPLGPNAYPFFIGVFDTVAALSNPGSLRLLLALYLAALLGLSWIIAQFDKDFWYWLFWLVVDTVAVIAVMYLWTHLKFSFRIKQYGFSWWNTVHLTTFRQKFYDTYLNANVAYARHAISIDERRADFKRVRWGNSRTSYVNNGKIPRFEQLWFAGNHADVGGGYEENESRLSDIALDWMVQATQALTDEKLLINPALLCLNPSAAGMQHDETRSLAFRLAGKSDRDPVVGATVHESVEHRFALGSVLQFDIYSEYRPEALRTHGKFKHYYANIPSPHKTCWQRVKAACAGYAAVISGSTKTQFSVDAKDGGKS